MSEVDPRRTFSTTQRMTWAQQLKRVFNIDIETCSECDGHITVIACFEDPITIDKILTHLKLQ